MLFEFSFAVMFLNEHCCIPRTSPKGLKELCEGAVHRIAFPVCFSAVLAWCLLAAESPLSVQLAEPLCVGSMANCGHLNHCCCVPSSSPMQS